MKKIKVIYFKKLNNDISVHYHLSVLTDSKCYNVKKIDFTLY